MAIVVIILVGVLAGVLMLYTLSASARNEIDIIDADRAVQRAKAEYAERNRLSAEVQALNSGSGPARRAA